MQRLIFVLGIVVCFAASALGQGATEGSLYAVGKQGNDLGSCPLKTTAVRADISGFLSRVRVRQEFENTFSEPIEAVYVFPLSQNGAVDDMAMTIGDRVIRGKILRREEARQTYETAKSEGKTASLLDQERPNVFTQSVANIMPGERVIVEISYVETLKYEDGAYEFVFPMVVAPRYIPDSVGDASKIKPPVAETRAGHDISIEVNLNAGVPVEEIRSLSHSVDQLNFTPNTAKITLKDEKTIPNKDFILRYDVTGKRIEDAVLTHRDERGGFFTLILQPPDKIASEDRTPKEIVFVLDTSGSMSGFPIEKAKEAMRLSLDGLYPEDTFNMITFAGDTAILFDKPRPATQANLEAAQAFLSARRGYGGTEMMTAIKAALKPSDVQDHLRIVCFMTDGEVGNDAEIIAEIQRHPNARVFSFGIGSSVNRFLLDKMAVEGKGEVEYVGLGDDGSKAAKRFYERVRSPLLMDLSIDWNGMPVADVYPGKLTDLFSAKPVILHGRYKGAANGTIKLRGKVAGQPYERSITVSFPETDAANDSLPTLWARTRIDELTSAGLKANTPAKSADINSQITSLGLEFRLLTQFTSFVAVEDRIVNQNGTPVKIEVPVEMPEGMSIDTSAVTVSNRDVNVKSLQNVPTSRGVAGLFYLNPGTTNSTGGGGGGGVVNASAVATRSGPPPPQPPAGGVMATVDVTAGQNIDVTSSSIGTNISESTISAIPIDSLHTGQGSAGGAGTGYGSGSGNGSGRGGTSTQVNGASGSENTFIIDGSELVTIASPANGRPRPRTISGGVLNGKAVNLPKPEYPAAALSANAKASVTVQITIGEDGSVESAQAVSGNPLFRSSAETAAQASKFAPTLVSGNPVKVTGVIVYKFEGGAPMTLLIDKMKVGPISPGQKRLSLLSGKLHTWLYAVVERINNGETSPTSNEALFVHDGMADIQIELSARSPSVIEKLKAAGFEFVADKGKLILVGKIALSQIAALAEIEEVKLILPKI